MIKKSILISVVFLLVLSTFIIAESFETGIPCEIDNECILEDDEELGFYCETTIGECVYDIESITDDATTDDTSTETTTEPETTSSSLSLELLTAVSNLEVRVNSLELGDNNLQQQLNNINSNLQSINSKLNEIDSVKSEVNSVAVGLASLESDLNKTSTELGTVDKKSSRNKFFIILFFLLIIGATIWGIMYYLKRKEKQLDPKTHKFISKHIKEGKKFPEIKGILKAAGWIEEEIKWAYKETIKKNYKEYAKKNNFASTKKTSTKKKTPKSSTNNQAPVYDKNKMIAIAVIGILLLGGVVFLLSGTTGQAVNIQKLVDGEVGGTSGKVTYDVKCTPPHTLNPSKDGCCLDTDANKICDYIEQQEKVVGKVESGAACDDNLQCPQGDLCINSQCQQLSNIYGQQLCESKCTYYGVKVKAIYSEGTEEKVQKECKTDNHCNDYISETSDQCSETYQGTFCVHKPVVEVYDLKPKQGSYGAAGAIEWKVLDSPAYCEGENAIVPIKIIRKDGKEIISEEIITLNQGETSEAITHPLYDGFTFKLKIDKISKPVGC